MVFKGRAKIDKPRAQWRSKLKEAGLRTTGPRMAVLRYLETAELPLSHSELVRPPALSRDLQRDTFAGGWKAAKRNV